MVEGTGDGDSYRGGGVIDGKNGISEHGKKEASDKLMEAAGPPV